MSFDYRFVRNNSEFHMYRYLGQYSLEEEELLRDVTARFRRYSMHIGTKTLDSTTVPLGPEHNTTDATELVNKLTKSLVSNLTKSSEVIYQILRHMIRRHQQALIIASLLFLIVVMILTIVLRRCCCGKHNKRRAIRSRYDVETTAHRTVCPAAKPLINKLNLRTVNETVRQEDDAYVEAVSLQGYAHLAPIPQKCTSTTCNKCICRR